MIRNGGEVSGNINHSKNIFLANRDEKELLLQLIDMQIKIKLTFL